MRRIALGLVLLSSACAEKSVSQAQRVSWNEARMLAARPSMPMLAEPQERVTLNAPVNALSAHAPKMRLDLPDPPVTDASRLGLTLSGARSSLSKSSIGLSHLSNDDARVVRMDRAQTQRLLQSPRSLPPVDWNP